MKKTLLLLLCAIAYVGTVNGQPKVVNSKFVKENAQLKAEAEILMEEYRVKKYAALERVAKSHGYSYKRSLLENDPLWGAGYNYSSDFPIGVSGYYAEEWYMFGVDLGLCINPKVEGTGSSTYSTFIKTVDDVVTEDNPVSYFKSTFKPVGYVTFTPSIYARYVAIGCGIGAAYGMKKEYEPFCTGGTRSEVGGSSTHITIKDGISKEEHSEQEPTTTTTETYELLENSSSSFNFMLRPTIQGFIPLKTLNSYDFRLSFNVAYNFVAGKKDLSGFSFGVGFLIEY